MTDSTLGLTIVFNGCIYNYRQLRTELRRAGHRFFSNGDTEVLLKAYKEWGEQFVERLHGMFSFCIVERAERALDAVQRLDIERLMPDDPVKRVDNMTMAWGLEARVPFLDHEFVELAARCPSDLKLAHGGKGVLKDAARQVLPPEVIDRPKGYFPLPALRSIDGPVLDLVRETLEAPACRGRGLFRPDYVKKLVVEPNRHRSQGGANLLWQLAILEMWLQSHEYPKPCKAWGSPSSVSCGSLTSAVQALPRTVHSIDALSGLVGPDLTGSRGVPGSVQAAARSRVARPRLLARPSIAAAAAPDRQTRS